MLSDSDISRHQAGTRIHHEQHHISFFNRQQGLRGHARFHTFFVTINTAGIDANKLLPFDLSTTIFTVTRQSRKIRHQRISRMR